MLDDAEWAETRGGHDPRRLVEAQALDQALDDRPVPVECSDEGLPLIAANAQGVFHVGSLRARGELGPSPWRRSLGRSTWRRVGRPPTMRRHVLHRDHPTSSPCGGRHAQPTRADERDGLRRDDPLPRRPARCGHRQRGTDRGDHRGWPRVLLGSRSRESRHHAQHRRPDAADHRTALHGDARRGDHDHPSTPPAGRRGRQRSRDRWRILPRPRRRPPGRVGRRLLPGGRYQQRTDRCRARPQLSPSPLGGAVSSGRDHVHRP